MGTYRLLADHYINDQLLEAGSTIEGPAGWTPTIAVDPTDADGIQAFFNAGPRGVQGAEHGTLSIVFNGNRWTGVPVMRPAHYWKAVTVDGITKWVVNGAEGLGFWPG